MIVIDINSGLGNQMLAYCVVLSMQKTNPNNMCYVETINFDIPEYGENVVSQWNGYELERIFGIATPNIKIHFNNEQWDRIMRGVRESKYWHNGGNYPPLFVKLFKKEGLVLHNLKGDFHDVTSFSHRKEKSFLERAKDSFFNTTSLGAELKRLYNVINYQKLSLNRAHPEKLFVKTEDDVFTGMWLFFKFNGNKIEEIEDDIRKTFVFPDFSTEKNREFAKFLDSCNSVFIHARRGDMLSSNGWCYKSNYFRKAVKHIRKNVKDPVFVFFTNTGSIEWCKENAKTFGLDYSKDKVFFVDWNMDDESYRDMQLMSHCKHGIITCSTFGWWGAYFIKNPNKITISPEPAINTTYHC